MSLHAQLSPEARQQLAIQKRNSTISSVLIAILGCTLLGLILFVISIYVEVKKTPEIVTYSSSAEQTPTLEETKVTNQIRRKPSAPSSQAANVIAANTASSTSVPTPEFEVTEAAIDFGMTEDFGDGDSEGVDEGFAPLPSDMVKRCSKEDRLARLAKEGGKPECEDAVVRTLNYLKKTQNKDGSWTEGQRCAMTGLALLAYLGHCETPTSIEYGETVEKAIVYLVSVGMKNNYKLTEDAKDHHWPYEHAMATYALAEAYTFCSKGGIEIDNLRDVVEKAGQFIIDNQHKSGAWVYSYAKDSNEDGDTSVACWQLQALKACHHAGIELNNFDRAIKKSMKYLEFCQNDNGAFGYRGKRISGEGPISLTSAGLLCMQQNGYGSRPSARKAAKILNDTLDYNYASNADLYAHYYHTQAMINRGGSEWKKYNAKFLDQHLSGQNPDGSWKSPGFKNGSRRFQGESAQAKHYRACLNTLMLEVYYRFLPSSGQ